MQYSTNTVSCMHCTGIAKVLVRILSKPEFIYRFIFIAPGVARATVTVSCPLTLISVMISSLKKGNSRRTFLIVKNSSWLLHLGSLPNEWKNFSQHLIAIYLIVKFLTDAFKRKGLSFLYDPHVRYNMSIMKNRKTAILFPSSC